MKYEIKHLKDYSPSLQILYKSGGGVGANVVERSRFIEAEFANPAVDPKNFRTTDNGETRIENCVKYDLPRGHRLVTIQHKNLIIFCYVGTHDNVDKWLNGHKGLTLSSDRKSLNITQSSIGINEPQRMAGKKSSLEAGFLHELLDSEQIEALFSTIPPLILSKLFHLKSTAEESDIWDIAREIADENLALATGDTLCFLRANDLRGASERIKLLTGESEKVESLSEDEIRNLLDGPGIKSLEVTDPNYQKVFDYYIRTAGYTDWMLFMQEEQEEIVKLDFDGSAKLFGVSGSGKTCIVVKRAIRLATKYPREKILILTLNRSLSRLIHGLVQAAAPIEMTQNIEVSPFFEVCQKYLKTFEPNNTKLYDDRTWKHEEHIDEIWSEFYRCELNNKDAEILHPVHDSLISRSIRSEDYIRDEFNWIRSALDSESRQFYLDVEREGRSIPFLKEFRKHILDGLEAWEKKMLDVGVTDYLGVSTALRRHLKKIQPEYRCILVDESQDFGTSEIEIIRAMANESENDLFFSGDAAQKVSYKHQDFDQAKISVPKKNKRTILKNYRNSKEILSFANKVLLDNVTEDLFDSKEFEFLDPEYADFSGSTPLVLEAQSISEEIGYAYDYLMELLGEAANKKACIAFCGYTLFEVEDYAKKYSTSVLNGDADINQGSIFFSDLQQTKGFEFDYLCIINTSEGALPDEGKPFREQFTDLAQLYVAMTRAKLEIIISFTGSISSYFSNANEYFVQDRWASYLKGEANKKFSTPAKFREIKEANSGAMKNLKSCTAKEFLYKKESLGMSKSLIEKLRGYVTGKAEYISMSGETIPTKWKNLGDLRKDLENYTQVRKQLGVDLDEFEGLFTK